MAIVPPRLSDGVTLLRAVEDADAPAYAGIHRDPLNVKWARSDAAMSDETALEQIRTAIPAGWTHGTSLRFAVVEAVEPGGTPHMIGTVSLHDIFRAADGGGSAEVGIKMAADGRGRGSARRAVELICGYAFGTLRMNVLHWKTTAGNDASRALAEKSGFVLAATVPGNGHVDGQLADSWVLSQTSEQWTAHTDAPAELDVRPVVPVLSDGTVVLRALTLEDADQLVANCLDPDAVRWTTVPLDYTGADARKFIEEITVDGWRSGKTLTFAVADAATNRLYGTVDLQCKDPGTAAVGILLGTDARGTGAAERAVRLLIDYAFGQLNLSYLHWTAMVPNWASHKLAWKLGFILEGTVRGDYNDRGTPADRWILTLAAADQRTPAGPWTGPVRGSR
jgi:RimJ/RimL family protein N-acetyltransferase